MKTSILKQFSILLATVSVVFSCQKAPQDDLSQSNLKASTASSEKAASHHTKINIENVLKAKPLVETGTFMNDNGPEKPPVIFPGDETSFSFSAGKGQYLSFATMYGWSNDLFFAPDNYGIKLYEDDGTPIEGDVSWEVKLWDNGSRVNQVPGEDVMHPGTPESEPITEVVGTDRDGNTYAAASDMMHLWLTYNGDSTFTLTIMNTSNETDNLTPFSPGVWAISYAPGGNLLMPHPIYQAGMDTTEGLTNIAEAGDIAVMHETLWNHTGIFTPLSPVLVVVYKGNSNPFYKVGDYDWGNGLKEIAQGGNAEPLKENLMNNEEVEAVYIVADPTSGVLLPSIDGNPGSKVSQDLWVTGGSKIAIATMYGLSNDWFFATKGQDVNALRVGDISSTIGLFDDGTGVNEFPGAGVNQAAQGGTPIVEDNPIWEVPNPNEFTSLPQIIKVTLNRSENE